MSKNQPSSLLSAIYETALDFHNCGVFSDEQMNEFEEIAPQSSVNLDRDIFEKLNKKCGFNAERLHDFINDLLRKNLDEMDSRAVV